MKTQQLEIKLSNKTEEDIKKARRKSTQAGERGRGRPASPLPTRAPGAQKAEAWEVGSPRRCSPRTRLRWGAVALCPGAAGGRGAALDLGPGGGGAQTRPRAQSSGLLSLRPQRAMLPGLASDDGGGGPSPKESDILFRERTRVQILLQRFFPQ